MSTDDFKASLHNEVKRWQIEFTNTVFKTSKLDSLSKFVSEKYYLITLPINELDDARRVIQCSEEIESCLTELDENIEITNSVYDLLNEYGVEISPNDETKLNILDETYRKLIVKVH